jgi:hypothetical protein
MENDSRPPWEAIHPALTADRLSAVGGLIVAARREKMAARAHRDSSWNLGCDCHQWVCHDIRQAAQGKYRDWLHVAVGEGDLDMLFRIGGPDGMPVKFYRTDAQGQPQRTLRISNPEVHAIQGMLALNLRLPKETVVRLAVDVDDEGLVTAITVVQLNQTNEVIYAWQVPLPHVGLFEMGAAAREQGVELPEPVVTTLEEEERTHTREASRKIGEGG